MSEWRTSTIELQRNSSIFGDIAVQFPKDDLNLIEAIFDKASVRLRNIVLASPMVGMEIFTRELFLLCARSRQNHIKWIPVKKMLHVLLDSLENAT